MNRVHDPDRTAAEALADAHRQVRCAATACLAAAAHESSASRLKAIQNAHATLADLARALGDMAAFRP